MALPAAYLWDPISLEHDNSPHVESIARAERLSPANIQPKLPSLDHRPVRPHDAEQWIGRIHEKAYMGFVKTACLSGRRLVDQGDTVVCPRSYDAALAAVNSILSAADLIAEGAAKTAFCAVRPPGHHALPNAAMGFCLFANISIGARYLQERHGVERIAIVDWDVHHGNGTQDIFYNDGSVLFISLHQHPLWPGTGMANESGEGAGLGLTVNVPIAPGTSETDYLSRFDRAVIPALDSFKPQVLMISAGFDAHADDPLGNLRLTAEGFGQLTRRLKEAAARHCDGRILSCLEGGYNLDALEGSVVAHVRALGDA